MKRIKWIRLGLVLMLAVCTVIGICACNSGSGGGSNGGGSTGSGGITGFDVEESISVNENELVTVYVPLVIDSNSNLLDVVYEVTTSDGGYVSMLGGNIFRASDLQGYVIRYVAISYDGTATYEKKTTVTVNSTANLELYAEFDIFAELGVESRITPVSTIDDAEFTYTVVNTESGKAIPVSNGVFVCEEIGWHHFTVTASANGKSVDYENDFYCREAMHEGEVEVFGSDWQTIRTLQEYGTRGATYTNTQETGVKDRFGLDSEFIKLESTGEYADLYINPRGDEAYYRRLAREGYTHISFWIYADCTIPHDVMVQFYPRKGLYTYDIGTVMPEKWTEIKVNIVEGKNYNESCFAAAVGYYRNAETLALQFDNTNGWNGPGGSYGFEDKMTFYISDIYAVKDSNITLEPSAKLNYKTGETAKLGDLFAGEEDLGVSYAVTFRGETVPADENYTFMANGTYTVNVIPAPNTTCNVTAQVTVTDDVLASKTTILVERTGDSVTVDLNEHGVTFTLDESALTPESATATLDGAEVGTGTAFTAGKDGSYRVEYKIPYNGYVSYVEITVDVWSAASKYLVSDASHMVASSEWRSWDKQPIYEPGEYNVGDKSGNMLKVTGMGEAALIAFRPFYTLAYYEELLRQEPTLKLVLEWYVVGVLGETVTSYTSSYSSSTLNSASNGKWSVTAVSFANFVGDYNKLTAGYNDVKHLVDNSITDTGLNHGRAANDYLLSLRGSSTGLKNATLYIADVYLTSKVEGENDGVWNDLTKADAVSTTVNPWSQVNRNGLVSADEVARIGGVTGAAYTSITASETWFYRAGYQIKPANTVKDLWEDWTDQDLVFDWYYEISGDGAHQNTFNVSVYGAIAKGYAQGEWHTSRISMADLLENWDAVAEGKNNGYNEGFVTPWTPWLQFSNDTANQTSMAGTVYMGNIRFDDHVDPPAPDPDAVFVEDVVLVETTGVTELDLSEIYTENGGALSVEELRERELVIELTTAYGAKITLENTLLIAVNGLSKCVYTVELKTKAGNLILSLTIDVYSQEDGLVWQDFDLLQENAVSYARVWQFGYIDLGRATHTTVNDVNVLQYTTSKGNDASNTNEIGLRLQPLHSKAYYEALEEDYESVTFDVHVTGRPEGMNIRTCEDTSNRGGWQANNQWKTYTVSLSYLLAHWDTLTNITGSGIGGSGLTQLFTSFDGTDGVCVISVGKFGAVKKSTGGGDEPGEGEEPAEGVIQGLVWNDLSQASAVTATLSPWNGEVNRNGKVSADEVARIGGKAGAAYTSATTTKDFNYGGYQIVPSNTSKDFWEAYSDCDIVFDWYYEVTGDTANAKNYQVQVYGAERVVYAQGEWHTSKVALADLLGNWANVIAGTNGNRDSSNWTPWLQFRWTSGVSDSAAGTVYLGNIRIKEAQSGGEGPGEGEEPEENVIEGLVWSDLSKDSDVTTTINPWSTAQATRNGKVSDSKVAELGGKAGAAYTSVSVGAGWLYQGGYQIVPSNTSKDFWEEYSDCELVFDWYYEVTDNTSFSFNVKVYGGESEGYAQRTWHTSKIALSDILADWADVIAGSNNKGRNSPWTPWIDFQWTSGGDNFGGIVYLGNIRIVRA